MKKRVLMMVFAGVLSAALYGCGTPTDVKQESKTKEMVEETEEIDDVEEAVVDLMEGEGFFSAEDALKSYVEAMQRNDIEEMISCYALETYVNNFDLAAAVERTRTYSFLNGMLPPVSDYSQQLNLELRRSSITESIRYQYLVLTDAEIISEDPNTIKVYNDYGELQGRFETDDSQALKSIEFDQFIELSDLSDKYYSDSNQQTLQSRANIYGADELKSVAAWVTINEKSYLLMADAVRYGDLWYLLGTDSSNIGNLLSVPTYYKGLISKETLLGGSY